ncbi:MAG: hypothetical protein KC496_01360, partial [Anaerolineae bacterium]|nr:hypothetical protein [Anaerolineae bacterium]
NESKPFKMNLRLFEAGITYKSRYSYRLDACALAVGRWHHISLIQMTKELLNDPQAAIIFGVAIPHFEHRHHQRSKW